MLAVWPIDACTRSHGNGRSMQQVKALSSMFRSLFSVA